MRSTDAVASLAVTLDGYVCSADGAVDYLENHPSEKFDFSAWSDRVGALVMGGGNVVTAAPNGGAVDTLDIMIVPEAIGEGLRGDLVS